jgi:hypothetical protein
MRTKLLGIACTVAALTAGCGSDGTSPGYETGGVGGSTSSQSGGTGSSGAGEDATGGGAGGSGVPGALCNPLPTCNAAPPDPGQAVEWTNSSSYFTVAAGAANHRGRDLYLNPGDPQWAIAKFSYGLIDKDLTGEQVDVYLLRDCGDSWELLGTATTTDEDAHAEVEGVADSGGRVYFEIPPDKALGLGRHRVRLIVRGDLTSTELFIEVVPTGTPMFVSDVDGTLTGSETEEFSALLIGELPTVHPGAVDAFHALVSKGYHPMYVTARPEWLVERTRELVATYGFPPGVIHTTLGLTGATGASASDYKMTELAQLAGKGMLPAWAFGNTGTDAAAYESAGVQPLSHRVFYQFDDSAFGGRRIEAYSELLADIEALPSLCE